MVTLLLVVHVVISLALIGLVIIQKSEGGASLFSGGAERVMKGVTYNMNSFLNKLTMYVVIAFFTSSIVLAIVFYSQGNFGSSIADEVEKTIIEQEGEATSEEDKPLVPVE